MSVNSSSGFANYLQPGSPVVWASWDSEIWENQYGLEFGECIQEYVYVQANRSVQIKPSITGISPASGVVGHSTTVTISGSGLGASPTVQVTGSGVTPSVNSSSATSITATFTISANAAGGNRTVTVTAGGQISNGLTFKVQVPSFVEVTLNNTSRELCDTLGFPGNTFNAYVRRIRYRVLDQDGTVINKSGMAIAEGITLTNDGCSTGAPAAGTWMTDSTGKMTSDDVITNCSVICYQGGSCTEAWNQTFTVDGKSVAVKSGTSRGSKNAVSVTCSAYPTVTVTP